MPTLISESRNKQLQKQVAISLLIISALLAALLFYYESKREEHAYEETYKSIQQSSLNSVNKLTTDINIFKKNIQLLSELPSIQKFLELNGETHNTKNTTVESDISSAFQALLRQEDNIRQARLILNNGNEYVRVDRNELNITVTPSKLLQSKEGRDYFKTGIALSSDELFISEISPNYEHGKIEIPLWPTYRIIKSLRNVNNEVSGLLVLNIDASTSLSALNTATASLSNTTQFEYFLIDSNGFYVAAPDKSLLFGKDLGNTDMNWFVHTEKNIPLSSNSRIQTRFMGKLYLFSSQELVLSNNQQSGHYFLVVGTPIDRVNNFIQEQRKELFISIIGFAFIILIIVYLSLRHINNLEGLYLNQSRFKAIISNSSDSILSINHNGEIQSWNYASSLLFGLKEEDAIGQSFFHLVAESEHFSPASLIKLLQSNTNERIEVPLKNNLNQKRTLLLTLCPIQKKDGDSESIALIIRDITFQKENQEKLEAANQNLDSEVKKRTKQLETEKQKAIKANEIKSMFVANISHEIRTPLNGISGLLSLARDKTNSDKQDDYLKMAQDSAQTLNILINDLLDLSKIESGKLELSPTPTNLKLLLESITASVFFLIKDKNIELILDTSRVQINHLILDDNRIKQVLTNLLSNAIKFTTEGEVILTASTFYHSDANDKVVCEFQICDTGVGISQKQQSKLFKPFVQASSGISNKYGGTGLGLSISKQLCEIMGGNITLESQSGEGSTFKASIFASKVDDTQIDQSTNIVADCEGKKIVLMVKNDQLRRILRNTLNDWKATIVLAHDLDELKIISKKTKPAALFLDSEYFDSKLDQALSIQNVNVIYLCTNNELDNKVPNTRILNRPFLPSILAKHLSTDTEQEINIDPSSIAVEKTKMLSNTQTVFIVDDNDINQIVAKGILSALNLNIDTAINGKDIIEKLQHIKQSNVLPVVLMDCQMPIMNGYEATRLIREGKAGEWLKSIPIIALTADAMDQNLEECKAAGMNDFLGKPFDPEVLKEMVLHWAFKNTA
tara:strand:+ start:13659 stop:16724 length:3066 start_codon:yes stop_codon:yes gene_type:complete